MIGGDSLEPALTRVHYTEQVRTAVQVQRDYTFTHPRYNQQHTATGDQDLNNQHKDYERYDYPGRYKRDIAGKPFTNTRLAALRNDAKLAHLEGELDAHGMAQVAAGYKKPTGWIWGGESGLGTAFAIGRELQRNLAARTLAGLATGL